MQKKKLKNCLSQGKKEAQTKDSSVFFGFHVRALLTLSA